MCSKTAVAPLDRIKILLQAHSTHYKHLGVFTGLRHIVRKESLWALYKGNSAQMVRIFPYAATQFTAFEVYKRVSVSPYVHTFLEAHTHTHAHLCFVNVHRISQRSMKPLKFVLCHVSSPMCALNCVACTVYRYNNTSQ